MTSLPLTSKKQGGDAGCEKVESFKMTYEKDGNCFKIENVIFRHIYKHNNKKKNMTCPKTQIISYNLPMININILNQQIIIRCCFARHMWTRCSFYNFANFKVA